MPRLLFILLFLLSPYFAGASHIMGGELSYTYISGNNYAIRLTVYSDCSAPPDLIAHMPLSAPTINLYNGTTFVTTVTLAIDSPSMGTDIASGCAGQLTSCNSTVTTNPGIRRYTYSATCTLPYAAIGWRFVFKGELGGGYAAGRTYAVSNIHTGTFLYLEATLNNISYNHSCPILLSDNPLPVCLNKPYTYWLNATGPDSLVFELIPAIDATTGSPVTYISPFTAVSPIHTAAGGFYFNPATGDITMTPDNIGGAIVTCNIKHYKNGAFIGSSQREICFVVRDCNYDIASGFAGSDKGIVVHNDELGICENAGDFSAYINPSGSDTSIKVAVTASGLPAGATFTTANNNTYHPHCTFSWSTSGIAPGTYTFSLTLIDNRCPVPVTKIQTYKILVVPVVGCSSITGVSPVTKTNEVRLLVSPNPGKSEFFLFLASPIQEIINFKVMDITGSIRNTFLGETNKTSCLLSALPNGIYIVSACTKSSNTVTRLIVAD